MRQANPQYITDNNGKKISVVLSIQEYKKILEELEEAEDIKLYDAVKSRKEPSMPFTAYLKQRSKK